MTRLLMDMAADALCLSMMLRLMGRPLRPLRTALSAVLGALSASGVQALGLSRGTAALFWLPTALFMAAIACGRWSLRAALLLLAGEGLLGGVIGALAGATGSLAAAWLIGAGAVSAMAVGAIRAQRAGRDVVRVRAAVTVRGCTASFEAIVDSGNSLRDYLTHRPVIVMPEDAARARLHLGGAALRPIFADTAGGRQMMGCLLPDRVVLETDGGRMAVKACLALAPGLSRDAPALIPPTLLRQDTGATEELSKEGDAYGKAEGEAEGSAGQKGDAACADDYTAGGDSRIHRRERFAARAADAGRGAGAVCADRGRAELGASDAHRAQPAAGGVHRAQV